MSMWVDILIVVQVDLQLSDITCLPNLKRLCHGKNKDVHNFYCYHNFLEGSTNTRIKSIHLPNVKCSVPGTASSGKAGSCLPLVGSLQYRTFTNCMYWFPLPFQLPIVI